MSHGELKKKWSWSVEWLHEELERGGGGGGGGAGGRGGGPGQGGYQGGGAGNPAPHLQYYSNWSPPAGSNETAHGYFLERSHSARYHITSVTHQARIREGGNIRLYITLVPKVLYYRFLIRWPNNFGDDNEF